MILTLEDLAALAGIFIVLLTPVYAIAWSHVGLISENTTLMRLIDARLELLEREHLRIHQ